ncbi:MAG: hypothetical protein WDO17_21155 [Alphaproteobacteria bacterium]
MTSMPLIDDDMVVQFQRAGKRRASFRPAQSGRRAAAQRVVLQRSAGCKFFGQACRTGGRSGVCDEKLNCIPLDSVVNPFPSIPGIGPFDF